MAKSVKSVLPAIAIRYQTLHDLLGKPVNDPAVEAVLARVGKVKLSPDFIVAKQAGFDISLEQPAGAKRNAKKLLATLFLFSEGKDGHRACAELPKGFAFAPRAELLARLPTPETTWKLGKGKVPVSTQGVDTDTWTRDGLEVSANYRDGVTEYLTVSIPEDGLGGREVATHPLHFETRPPDAPPDAELVGMALLVAWAADRFGLPAKHAGSALGVQLVKRAITPRTFLVGACNGTLATLDFDPKLVDFVWGYTHRMFLGDDDADTRAKADAKIAKMLGLGRDDERAYTDDFLASFAKIVKNPFHVPDSWEAVDRIAPVLDARFADYQATAFATPPDLALYERAAKLRDSRAITPTRAAIAKATADDALADDLVALLDRPLTDKAVKAVLARAGLPIGKRIDEQANPALGVSYTGAKFKIAGKPQLGVADVCFYASKQTSYIRGIGDEVEFVGYPGALPHGLRLGARRAEVADVLGSPRKATPDYDYWSPSKRRLISCRYARSKLVFVRFGRPADS